MKVPRKISPLVKESVKEDAETRTMPVRKILFIIFGIGIIAMGCALLYAYFRE